MCAMPCCEAVAATYSDNNNAFNDYETALAALKGITTSTLPLPAQKIT